MDIEGYYQQLQALNQMLEQDLEENERAEMLDLKQNIEELLSLTKELDKKPTPEEVTLKTEIKEVDMKIENEYALFMAELAKEGALDIKNENSRNDNQSIVMKKYSTIPKNILNFKNLEGKKFRAPHKHQWGQVVYHNAMVCSVPDEIPANNEFEVKVLFLNPTHKEMQPCPYYFHSEKDCHYSEEECRFSHGELVPFSSLEQYIEPKFELLAVGSDVLAKQSNDLWYRAKITHISKETCLVKFDSKNVENQNFEEVVFAHILPLETESGSDNASVNDSDIEDEDFEMQIENDCLEAKLRREELINTSLMNIPENQPLGDWEKYTKGIGSKLMQKMGYIVGTGLGKKGAGIIKPVTAIILPQGKSLDYCMNLKEKRNNPNLFNADHKASKSGRKEFKRTRREEKTKRKSERRVERMDIGKFLRFRFSFNKDCRPFTEEKEYELVRKKLKDGTDKNLNVANFVVEAKLKEFNEVIFKLKTSIRQAEELHTDTKKLHERLCNREYDVKNLSTYLVLVKNEIGRRKNNKEMSVF